MGIMSLIAVERAIYSDSFVLRDISVCSLLDHKTGQPKYLMKNPVLDTT